MCVWRAGVFQGAVRRTARRWRAAGRGETDDSASPSFCLGRWSCGSEGKSSARAANACQMAPVGAGQDVVRLCARGGATGEQLHGGSEADLAHQRFSVHAVLPAEERFCGQRPERAARERGSGAAAAAGSSVKMKGAGAPGLAPILSGCVPVGGPTPVATEVLGVLAAGKKAHTCLMRGARVTTVDRWRIASSCTLFVAGGKFVTCAGGPALLQVLIVPGNPGSANYYQREAAVRVARLQPRGATWGRRVAAPGAGLHACLQSSCGASTPAWAAARTSSAARTPATTCCPPTRASRCGRAAPFSVPIAACATLPPPARRAHVELHISTESTRRQSKGPSREAHAHAGARCLATALLARVCGRSCGTFRGRSSTSSTLSASTCCCQASVAVRRDGNGDAGVRVAVRRVTEQTWRAVVVLPWQHRPLLP